MTPRSILEDPATRPGQDDPLPAAERACPRCGAPLRAEQDWCLSCGTAVTTRVARAPGWRAPMAILAGLLALALAGLIAAFLAVSDDPKEVARTPASASQKAASPSPTPAPIPATPTPEPDPISPDTIPPATGGDQPPADEPPSSGTAGSGVGAWPAGRSAWTVIMVSSPSRATATRKAKQLNSGGTDVGILKSADFKSLRAGYYVVFSGQYGSQKSAQAALAALRAKAPEAYVRRVTPR